MRLVGGVMHWGRHGLWGDDHGTEPGAHSHAFFGIVQFCLPLRQPEAYKPKITLLWLPYYFVNLILAPRGLWTIVLSYFVRCNIPLTRKVKLDNCMECVIGILFSLCFWVYKQINTCLCLHRHDIQGCRDNREQQGHRSGHRQRAL